jgi:hypothetical protein
VAGNPAAVVVAVEAVTSTKAMVVEVAATGVETNGEATKAAKETGAANKAAAVDTAAAMTGKINPVAAEVVAGEAAKAAATKVVAAAGVAKAAEHLNPQEAASAETKAAGEAPEAAAAVVATATVVATAAAKIQDNKWAEVKTLKPEVFIGRHPRQFVVPCARSRALALTSLGRWNEHKFTKMLIQCYYFHNKKEHFKKIMKCELNSILF